MQYTIEIRSTTNIEMAKNIVGQCKVELFFWLIVVRINGRPMRVGSAGAFGNVGISSETVQYIYNIYSTSAR